MLTHLARRKQVSTDLPLLGHRSRFGSAVRNAKPDQSIDLGVEHRLARLVRDLAAPLTSRLTGPLLVNSFGRSGSTMLFKSLASGAAKEYLGPRAGRTFLWGSAWDLQKSPPSAARCYKTHDYPPREVDGRMKCIYIYRDPISSTGVPAPRVGDQG